MLRKVFRTGNSTVISLPKEYLAALNIESGSEVNIELDRENSRLTVAPVPTTLGLAGIDEGFTRQVAEVIEEDRTALEALAKNP